jgi:hypothetical protein
LFVWWGLPEKGSIANGPAGTLEFEKDDVYVRSSDGKLKLVDIEITKERMRGHEILEFFKKREGVILK